MAAQARKSWTDLYYEDIVVGEVVETPRHTVTQAAINTFAEVTLDDHPLHVDLDYCAKGPFGRPIAHGLMGLSLMEGLKMKLSLYRHTSIASLGWDKVRFVQPIFPDDTIHVRMTFKHKRESKKPDRGVVTEFVELVNQKGEVAIAAEHVTLLWKKGHAPATSSGH